ncbi:MAG: NUDIX domain-containing protein [Candidatus Nealsonbacteria bacterium]
MSELKNKKIQKAKVGVGVIIKKGEKILLIKREGSHGAGTWAPPGGHIDFGESVFNCAKREVKEEIGIKIKNLKAVGITEDLFKKEKKHYITIWVTSDWKSGKPKKYYREYSEIGWFSWKKLPKPLSVFLKNYLAGKILPR